MIYTKENLGVIADTHIPAVKEGYLDFCVDTFKKYNCKEFVHVGDVVDFHGINYHEKDPEYKNITEELKHAKAILKNWIKAFPKLRIVTGNHDLLIYRKAKTHGLPKDFFRTYNQILGTPEGWKWDNEWYINNIKFLHGTGFTGRYAHSLAMQTNRINCVMGHMHSVFGIEYSASKKDLLWGMCVGSGVDDRQCVFDYGADTPRRSVLGCGVIVGGLPVLVPMPL